jgi:hypothetical protein
LHAASVSSKTFNVQKDKRALALSFEGAGAAPRVRLRSPSGKVYDFTKAVAKPVKLADAFGQIVPSEDRTFVILAHPQAGSWTVSTLDRSPTVNRIRMAHVLAKPRVTGRVSGKGASRTLAYSVHPLKGQVVRFMEEARGSTKEIGHVKGGGHGKIHFLTGEATGTKRTIVAEVFQDRLPRTRLVIAHFTAPNPKIGRPGNVRVHRGRGKAVVTWRRARLAKAYDVGVTDTNGGQFAYYVAGGRTRLVIRHVAKSVGLHVIVVGISASGRHGPPGTEGLTAKKQHRRHHKKHHHGP